MDGRIRKIKITHPFKIQEQERADVFIVDETQLKGKKVHSIVEEIDPVIGLYSYKIYLDKGGSAELWKKLTPPPGTCTKEIEYFITQ